MLYRFMIYYDDEDQCIPSGGSLLRVTEIEPGYYSTHGIGSRVTLEPAASDVNTARNALAQWEDIARGRLEELMQARREFERQLADVKENRDYWYDKAVEAEARWDKARKEAQAQSDEVQRDWLSPVRRQLSMLQSAVDNLCEQNERQIDMEACGARCSYPSKFPDRQQAWDEAEAYLRHGITPAAKPEAKVLKRQLTKAEARVVSCRKATEWLWGYYDGNTLVARPGYEDDIRAAWDDLLVATDTRATSELLDRLATLDAAEAALADARRVAAAWFRRAQEVELTAAVLKKLVKELSEEHDQLVNRIDDAMAQMKKWDEQQRDS